MFLVNLFSYLEFWASRSDLVNVKATAFTVHLTIIILKLWIPCQTWPRKEEEQEREGLRLTAALNPWMLQFHLVIH